MENLWRMFRQAYPAKPTFTEKNVPDMSNKVRLLLHRLDHLFLRVLIAIYLGRHCDRCQHWHWQGRRRDHVLEKRKGLHASSLS